MTASFRALYERLVFQNLTYNKDVQCCNENPIPVLIIMTSNGHDHFYDSMLQKYQYVFNLFVGPTEYFVYGETRQLKDYSKTDWPWYFDAEEGMKDMKMYFRKKERKHSRKENN